MGYVAITNIKRNKKNSSQFVRTLKVENKKCNGFYWKYKITQN